MTQKSHLEDGIKPPNLKRISLKQDDPHSPSVVYRNLPSKCRQLCRLNLLFDVDGRLTEPCTACWIPAETANPVKIGPYGQQVQAALPVDSTPRSQIHQTRPQKAKSNSRRNLRRGEKEWGRDEKGYIPKISPMCWPCPRIPVRPHRLTDWDFRSPHIYYKPLRNMR